MYGASLTSTCNFCDTFWQISVMGLLNFNLQSKFMLSSFSLRELFVCKSSILSVLGSWLFKKWWQLSVFRVFVFPGPRPFAWPPALALVPAPNLYLPAVAPNFCLPALAPICIYWPWPTIFINVLRICIYLLSLIVAVAAVLLAIVVIS